MPASDDEVGKTRWYDFLALPLILIFTAAFIVGCIIEPIRAGIKTGMMECRKMWGPFPVDKD